VLEGSIVMQVRGDWITSRAASAAPAASFLSVIRRTMRRETNDQERSMQLSENHGRLVASPPEGFKAFAFQRRFSWRAPAEERLCPSRRTRRISPVWFCLRSAQPREHHRGLHRRSDPVSESLLFRVCTARRIFHGDHQTLFAWKVCQVVRKELRYLSLLCYQRAGHETCQRQNQFCECHKLTFRLIDAISMLRMFWSALRSYA